MTNSRRVVFAIGAHPDDIEFMMAGTLFLLKRAGCELHYMNIANGSCGTAVLPRDEIVRLRAREARAAAKLLDAVFHPSLVNDFEIYYEAKLLRRVGAVVRKVNPQVLLLPSPQDYMEDHMNAARLAVTAAFCRSMPNFPTTPQVRAVEGDVVIYHALPYGLRDAMRRRLRPEMYVNITSVLDAKREMLACHRSQKEWLDVSQGLDAYLTTMQEMSAQVGRLSGRFEYAEGWRRHSHLGFAADERDPLSELLATYAHIDASYQRRLDAPAAASTSRRRSS
jgi:LmbE family N-acetylglucosaminyl deacetylase